jgi:UDP-2,4-diacetamido-2,4,6-trideoxy-beta-L-altropyranose hydrolase
LGVSWKEDIEDTINGAGEQFFDWLLVDHYAIDYRWHQVARNICNKIMVIDDLADRKYDCDLLLDQTYGRNAQSYYPLVNKQCQLLIGPQYALLRDEFFKLRSKALGKRNQKNKIERIVVSMGSMDPDNLTSLVLKGLDQATWISKPIIDVVLSSCAPHLESVIKEAKTHALDINVHIDVSNMAELMLSSDLAIGSGGTTSWERCCLGLPTIILELANNQKKVIRGLTKAGAVRHLSGKNIIEGVVSSCCELQSDVPALQNLSKNSFRIVNGIGAHMIALKLFQVKTQDGEDIAMRYVNQSDGDLMYKWQTDPKTRLFFDNPALPKYEEHRLWLEKKLNDHTCFLFMMEYNNRSAGIVRLDHSHELDGNCFYIVSIYIALEFYRKGIGIVALNYVSRVFESVELKAKIHEENIASQHLFLKAGYKLQKNGELYQRMPLNVER